MSGTAFRVEGMEDGPEMAAVQEERVSISIFLFDQAERVEDEAELQSFALQFTQVCALSVVMCFLSLSLSLSAFLLS